MPPLSNLFFLSVTFFLMAQPPGGDMDLAPSKSYIESGDISVGVMVSIGKDPVTCQLTRESLHDWQVTEALVYAIKKVNADPRRLAGVKLGFTILDICQDERRAVSNAHKFHSWKPGDALLAGHDFSIVCMVLGIPLTFVSLFQYYFARENILQISFWPNNTVASSNNFLSLVPFFDSEMGAIVDFLSRMGWSYFSVVLSQTPYGNLCLQSVRRHIDESNICIHEVHWLGKSSKTKTILRKLMANRVKARVVLLIGSSKTMKRIFRRLESFNAQHKLIWVGTYGWDGIDRLGTKRYRHTLTGSFSTGYFAPKMTDFQKYLGGLKPSSSQNPWLKDLWKEVFNCSLKEGTCRDDLKFSASSRPTLITAAFAIDSIFTLADSLDRLVKEKCPKKKGKAKTVCLMNYARKVDTVCTTSSQGYKSCTKNPYLLQKMVSTNISGLTGRIRFKKGDAHRIGTFIISQVLSKENGSKRGEIYENPVRRLSGPPNFFYQKLGNITWKFVEIRSSPIKAGNQPAITLRQEPGNQRPISACSRACGPKERKVIGNSKRPCCWKCVFCYPNEIVLNEIKCRACKTLMWPDPDHNYSRCKNIKIGSDDILNKFALNIVIIFSSLGLAFTFAVFIFYIVYRNNRLVRASGRELSLMQLISFLFGFVGVPLFMSHPYENLCVPSFFLFCLAYNGIYVTIAVKNVRIYRLFKAASKGQRKIKGVKPLAQVSIFLLWGIAQCLVCAAVVIIVGVQLESNMPNEQKMYVETYCQWSQVGYATLIGPNLGLIALASYFAYLTRRLPGAFHESKNLFICVATTLMVWVSFAISKSMFKREHEKINTFCVVAIINLFAMLFCLHSLRVSVTLLGRAQGFSMRRSGEKRKTNSSN